MQAIFKRLEQFRKNRQRVFIIPSRFGFVLALFLIVMLLGAMNYSNSMAHLLVFLLISLAHTAMLHTHRNLAKVRLKYCHADPVFAGQPAIFDVTLENGSQRAFHQLDLAVKTKTIGNIKFFSAMRGFEYKQTLSQLPAEQSMLTHIRIETHNRGFQPLKELRVSTQFPLGLFYCWTQFKTSAQVLVYPKPMGSLPLPFSHELGDQFQTSTQSGLDDFAGFNKYRIGDASHSIAWKALAKDDVMRTKQFHAAQSQRCQLRWQDTQGETEARLSQLCQWLLDAEQYGISTQLELPHKTIAFGHGPQHLSNCLTELALYVA